jgi:tetratricopeptide (TPR) repeat protein
MRVTTATPAGRPPVSLRTTAAVFLVLLTAVLLAYLPAWHGGPLWDDDAHLTAEALRGLPGLRRIWFDLGATQQYYPLLHSTFWLMDRLWGTSNTLPYHLLNITLHATSALLLMRILQTLRVPGAPLAAVIFALHPVHVESVAWMTELKNTLSGVWYFTAALLYLRFDRTRARSAYALALGAFVLALLSKTVAATLPAALLVVFWWQRGWLGWRQDVRPLLPFFAAGVGAGLFTAWVERHFIGAAGAAFDLSPVERVLLASRAAWFYLSKLAWPADLMFIYPRWEISSSDPVAYLYLAGAAAALAGCWAVRHRTRAPLAVALLFGGTLVPALGFFDVFPFRYSFVADHFQYLATAAPIAGFAALLAGVILRPPLQAVLSATLALTLGIITWQQSAHYTSAETLYRETLARNPQCWMCHNNLSTLIVDAGGELDAAMAHLEASLGIYPDNEEAHNNRGVLLRRMGRKAEAIPHLEEAIRLSPNYVDARRNLGVALREAGRLEEALAQYRHLIRLNPSSAEDHEDAGGILLALERHGEAVTHLQRALDLNPDLVTGRNNLGAALSHLGRIEEALPHFRAAVQRAPSDVIARNNLAAALGRLKRVDEAVAEYQTSLRLDPTSAKTHDDLAYLLLRAGRREDAAAHLERALALDPDYAPAHLNVGNLLVDAGRPAAAIVHYQRALAKPSGIDRAQVHSNLGVAFALMGDRSRAIMHFNEALRIRPGFPEALANLQRVDGKW